MAYNNKQTILLNMTMKPTHTIQLSPIHRQPILNPVHETISPLQQKGKNNQTKESLRLLLVLGARQLTVIDSPE